jgi:hypothetical protein
LTRPDGVRDEKVDDEFHRSFRHDAMEDLRRDRLLVPGGQAHIEGNIGRHLESHAAADHAQPCPHAVRDPVIGSQPERERILVEWSSRSQDPETVGQLGPVAEGAGEFRSDMRGSSRVGEHPWTITEWRLVSDVLTV